MDVGVAAAQVLEALGFVLDVAFLVALLDFDLDQSLHCLLVLVDVVHAEEHFALGTGTDHLHHFEVLDAERFHVGRQFILGVLVDFLSFVSADDEDHCLLLRSESYCTFGDQVVQSAHHDVIWAFQSA